MKTLTELTANNRNPGWGYDVEGNIVSDDDAVYQVDAAGRVVETMERELDESTEFYPPTKDNPHETQHHSNLTF